MWAWLSNFFVGLFRGWLGERSRDMAHEDLGEARANLEHEQQTKEKADKANTAGADVGHDSASLLNDPNNRDD